MAPPYYKTLQSKIVAATLFFSLVPLFALGITIYYQFSGAYKSKVMESVRSAIENRRSALELFFEERIAQLTTLAQHQSLQDLLEEKNLSQIFNTMQSRSKSYTDIGVIDEKGNHVAYVGPYYDKLKHVNYANEAWFTSATSSGTFISDVFLGFRKIPHFIIAVTRREGNKTWIVRATINLDVIEGIMRRGQQGRNGDAYIVNRFNILQTAPRFAGKILGPPSGPNLAGGTGTKVETIEEGGTRGLYASSHLSKPDWVVIIKEDLREEMLPLSESRHLEALILIAGALLVIVGTVFTSRSMTHELMKVEREKAAADEAIMHTAKMAALGKMAAGVAHEINNPLQVISEQAGWMRDLLEEDDIKASPNAEEFRECLIKIERNLQRCRSVTHRMLHFGRRMEPRHELVDLNAIIAETITFLANEARFREIDVRTDFCKELPRITTDPAQFQQVVLNIVDNAIDAIGKSGVVKVATSINKGNSEHVIVEITDNGPGISKEMMNKVFDPFFTTKDANSGTGLGLSISYGIIEKLGGKITVASEVGKGTTFTISLPVV